jgi:hypothetical protein
MSSQIELHKTTSKREKGKSAVLNSIFLCTKFPLLSISDLLREENTEFLPFFPMCTLPFCSRIWNPDLHFVHFAFLYPDFESGSTGPMIPNPQSKRLLEEELSWKSVGHLYKKISFCDLIILSRLENLENAGNSLW